MRSLMSKLAIRAPLQFSPCAVRRRTESVDAAVGSPAAFDYLHVTPDFRCASATCCSAAASSATCSCSLPHPCWWRRRHVVGDQFATRVCDARRRGRALPVARQSTDTPSKPERTQLAALLVMAAAAVTAAAAARRTLLLQRSACTAPLDGGADGSGRADGDAERICRSGVAAIIARALPAILAAGCENRETAAAAVTAAVGASPCCCEALRARRTARRRCRRRRTCRR